MRMELRFKYPCLIFKQLKDSLKFTTLISFQDILYGIFQKYYLLFGFVLLLCEEISFLQPLYLLLITCFFFNLLLFTDASTMVLTQCHT